MQPVALFISTRMARGAHKVAYLCLQSFILTGSGNLSLIHQNMEGPLV